MRREIQDALCSMWGVWRTVIKVVLIAAGLSVLAIWTAARRPLWSVKAVIATVLIVTAAMALFIMICLRQVEDKTEEAKIKARIWAWELGKRFTRHHRHEYRQRPVRRRNRIIHGALATNGPHKG